MHELKANPDDSNLDVDKLKGGLGYRVRVGQYRIIFSRHDDELIIEVVRIRPRGDIYKEPLYDQDDAEEYIFMNPVKRERLERGWTQKNLADRLGVKQSTVAKWETKGPSTIKYLSPFTS